MIYERSTNTIELTHEGFAKMAIVEELRIIQSKLDRIGAYVQETGVFMTELDFFKKQLKQLKRKKRRRRDTRS
jgi:hypothetical protein